MTTAFASQLKTVQRAAEDFEWYPTTNEIIAALVRDLGPAQDRQEGTLRRRQRLAEVVELLLQQQASCSLR